MSFLPCPKCFALIASRQRRCPCGARLHPPLQIRPNAIRSFLKKLRFPLPLAWRRSADPDCDSSSLPLES